MKFIIFIFFVFALVACQADHEKTIHSTGQVSSSGNGGHYTGTEDFLRGSFLWPQEHYGYTESCEEEMLLPTTIEIRHQSHNFFLQRNGCPQVYERPSLLNHIVFPLIRRDLDNFPESLKVLGFEGRIYHHENSQARNRKDILGVCRGIQQISIESGSRALIFDFYLQKLASNQAFSKQVQTLLVVSYLDRAGNSSNDLEDLSEDFNDEGDIFDTDQGGIENDTPSHTGVSEGASFNSQGQSAHNLTSYDGELLFLEDVNATLLEPRTLSFVQNRSHMAVSLDQGGKSLFLEVELTNDPMGAYYGRDSFRGTAQIESLDLPFLNDHSFYDLEMNCHMNY